MNISNRIIFGLGLGSFIYLLTQLVEKPKAIITVIIISVFSGILTIVFDTEKLCFLKALVIHYVSINTLVITLSYFNGWIRDTSSLIGVLTYTSCLYFISWCVVIIKNRIKAKELNSLLKKQL